MQPLTKRLQPAQVALIRLFWEGDSMATIAIKTGLPEHEIESLLTSDSAQAILQQLNDQTFDSMGDIEAAIQLGAVKAVKRKLDLIDSIDERVANSAATDILHMAGHAPVKRVRLERQSPTERKYANMTDDEIQLEIAQRLGLPAPGDANGPDGRPLN